MKISQTVLVIAMVFVFALGLTGPMMVLAASPATVNLGTAGSYVILTKTGISTTGSTAITGNIGVSPIDSTAITGFGLILPAASAFSTSALVTGKAYAPDYANPTPANLTTAIGDMETAYTDTAGRAADVTELGAGNIGGLTLAPGVYKWSTGVTIPTDVTLSGNSNDIWIFQIAQNLDISSATKIVLAGGAKASNIFWVVAGQTTIGTTAVFNGNILDQTAIILNTGAVLNGRALAQSAVTLDANSVSTPSGSTPAIPATPTTPATPSSEENNSATPATSSSEENNSATPTTSTSGGNNSATPTTSTTPAISADKSNQAKIDNLMVTLKSLLIQLEEKLEARLEARQQGSSVSTLASSFGQQVKTITTDLTLGNNSNAVNTLQQFLMTQGKGSASQALTKTGGTMYFGNLTRAALAEWQKSVGVMPASGYFGPITRAYLKAN